MGLGKLGGTNVIIPRQNRWTMESKNLDIHVCQAIEFDYHNNTIEMTLLDVIWHDDERPQPNSLFYISLLNCSKDKEESLLFKTYDGTGAVLYSQQFEGLSLISHTSTSFDYKKSEAAAQIVTVKYRDVITHYFRSPPKPPVDFINLKDKQTKQMYLDFLNKMVNKLTEA